MSLYLRTTLTHICQMTHPYMRRDSHMPFTWLDLHVYMCMIWPLHVYMCAHKSKTNTRTCVHTYVRICMSLYLRTTHTKCNTFLFPGGAKRPSNYSRASAFYSGHCPAAQNSQGHTICNTRQNRRTQGQNCSGESRDRGCGHASVGYSPYSCFK